MVDKLHAAGAASPKAVSLFASGGIGDLGLRAAGIETICSNELLPERAALFEKNFPDCSVFSEDIYECVDKIISTSREKLHGEDLFLLLATPPCQGMSSNGLGKLLSEVRKGNRSELDPRNRLILPALKIAKELNPEWILFENVPGMENTVIDYDDKPIRILDVVNAELSPKYSGAAYVVEMADYGVPQRRKRLITVYTRNPIGKKIIKRGGQLIPAPTHDKDGADGRKRWVSVADAISSFPPLDAKRKESAKSKENVLHRVPVLDEEKYFWISNTPLNDTAFNNQCVNPACRYQNNPRHGSLRTDGINHSRTDTPIYCVKCGKLLPRPCVEDDTGKKRIMKGFISAYKRMNGQLPAPALTTNFMFPCSDHKIHPTQNRVLSLAEACVIQTIGRYEYEWGLRDEAGKVKSASTSLIRDVIGESVPPYFTEQESRFIRQITERVTKLPTLIHQRTLLENDV